MSHPVQTTLSALRISDIKELYTRLLFIALVSLYDMFSILVSTILLAIARANAEQHTVHFTNK